MAEGRAEGLRVGLPVETTSFSLLTSLVAGGSKPVSGRSACPLSGDSHLDDCHCPSDMPPCVPAAVLSASHPRGRHSWGHEAFLPSRVPSPDLPSTRAVLL